MAFSPQGDILWQTSVNGLPVGTPALDAQGHIYVADERGHVSAFDSQGNLLWDAEASASRQATSGPVAGSNGMIYVTLIDAVAGISSDGTLIWRKTAADIYVDVPPRLNADESLVYLKNTALSALTGQIQELQIVPPVQLLFTEPAFFTGTDGRSYYRNGHEVIRWHIEDSLLQVDSPRTWEYATFVLFNPLDQGVIPNQLAWLFYSSEYSDGRVIWLDEQSRLVGNFEFPYANSRLIAIGEKGEAYLCGPTGRRIQCVAALPGVSDPLWEIYIEDNSSPVGGALVPGTMYIATQNGSLYAISSGETQP